MKVLDLFCGAGGFSCGFLSKGNSFIGVDTWPIALETYRNNIKGEAIEVNVMDFDPTTVGRIDALIGSPPCQPYSTANRFGDHDPTLIKRYLEIRDISKPKWWVMEEVPGAAKTGLIPEEYVKYLKACDFGLPHVRNRLYAGNYPEPKKRLYKGNYWESPDGKHSTNVIPTPQTAGIQGFKYERERGYPCMENLKAMIKTPIAAMRGYYHGKEDKERMTVKIAKMFPTPCANHHNGMNGGARARETLKEMGYKDLVTPAFCAKVMGFPSWYEFVGNKTQKYRQIGNAVCPPVARAIWNAIQNPPKGIEDFW